MTTTYRLDWTTEELSGIEKTFNYNDYIFLIISTGAYSNIMESIVVTTDYFSATYSSNRIILCCNESTIEVWKNSSNSIYVKGTSLFANQRVHIDGILKKK